MFAHSRLHPAKVPGAHLLAFIWQMNARLHFTDWNLLAQWITVSCSPMCHWTYGYKVFVCLFAFKYHTERLRLSVWHPSFHVLRLFPFRWLTPCSHSCRFPSNPAVLSCCHSSELEPLVKGDSPSACFHREQHLDLQTSVQPCPVWGQEDQN